LKIGRLKIGRLKIEDWKIEDWKIGRLNPEASGLRLEDLRLEIGNEYSFFISRTTNQFLKTKKRITTPATLSIYIVLTISMKLSQTYATR
jgi:hypothetical protein